MAQASLSTGSRSHLLDELGAPKVGTLRGRFKRVFNIDIETCGECGGSVKVMPKALAALAGQALAFIEDPLVIEKILTHLREKLTPAPAGLRPASRAPPADLFG